MGASEPPSVVAYQLFICLTETPPCSGTCPAGELPLGLRRQAVSGEAQVVTGEVQLSVLVLLVTPLVLGNPFPFTQPVAVRGCVVPGHQIHLAVRSRRHLLIH